MPALTATPVPALTVTPVPALTVTPVPALTAQEANAKAVAELRDSVDVLCGHEPKSDWCSNLKRVDGEYAIDVGGTSVLLWTNLADDAEGRMVAKGLCAEMALAHFDSAGVDLGVRDFHVQDVTDVVSLADCNVPGY